MKNLNSIQQKVSELMDSNNDLTNFKVLFSGHAMYLQGEFVENGSIINAYTAGVLGYYYIPTSKGYISSEWKNTSFSKMEGVEVTESLFNELNPFFQEKSPKSFIIDRGVSVANVLANHVTKNGGDIYCTQ